MQLPLSLTVSPSTPRRHSAGQNERNLSVWRTSASPSGGYRANDQQQRSNNNQSYNNSNINNTSGNCDNCMPQTQNDTNGNDLISDMSA